MTLPNKPTAPLTTASGFRRVCDTIFGDKLFSNRIKLGVALVAVTCLTYVLCVSNPWSLFGFLSSETKRSFAASDKVMHGTAYFVLSMIFMWYAATKSRTVVIAVIGIALLHGVGTEIAQRFVPERTFDLSDLVADFLGVFLGALVGLVLRRFVDNEDVPLATQRILTPGVQQVPSPMAQMSDGSESLGLAREQVDSEEISLIQPRMINLRFVGILCGAGLVVLSSVYAIHGWQVQRNAKTLLELGRKAHDKGKVQKAKEYFNRYVGMVPNDVNALADFGTLLDTSRDGKRGGHRVFMVFEKVLRSEPTRDDIRRRQIKVAMEIGRTNDALAHATILRQANPKDGELHFLEGLCHEQLEEFEKATEAFQRAIDHSPQLVDAYSHYALIEHREFDRPKRASELFDALMSHNSKNVDAWLARSLYRKDTQQFDDADADMQQALKLQGDDARIILAATELGYARATAAEKGGRDAQSQRIVAQTRRLLKDGFKKHPDHLGLRLQSVLLESHFGNEELALQQVDAILTDSPSDARAQLLLADLTIERGDFERAQDALMKLPRTPTSDALRLFLKGRILMAERQWDDAVAQFEKARRFMAESPSMLERTDLALARCHAAQKNHAAELADYRRVLKYRPESVPGRIGLAASFLRMKQLPQAIAEYKQLSHLSQVRLMLVQLLMIQNMQMPEVAREWRDIQILLDEAKEAGDHPTQVVLLQAELLALQGQLDDARHVIETARTKQADRVEFLMALGRLANKSGEASQAALWMGQAMAAVGNVAEAETQLLKALQEDPRNATAGQALMRFYLKQKRHNEAITVFQKVVRAMSKRQQARSYALFGDLQRAVQLYRAELKSNPNDFDVIQGLSDLYLNNGLPLRAKPLLEKLLDNESLLPESQLQATRRKLAVLLAGSGSYVQYTEALNLLEKNRGLEGSFDAANQRAQATILAASREKEDWRRALEILEALEDQQQLVPNDRWLMGRLYDQLGQSDQATKQFNAAIRPSDNRPELLRQYVAHLIRIKHLEQADQWLSRLKEKQPTAIQTITLDVYLKTSEGNSDEALNVLESLARDSTGSSIAQAERMVTAADIATVAAKGNDTPELTAFAEDALQRAVRLDRSRVSQLVIWLIEQGRSDDSLELIGELWQSARPEAAAGLSMTLLGLTTDDTYIESIEKHVALALGRNPKSLPLKVFLADLLSLKNEISDAEEMYRDILQSDRNNLPALNNLAWLLAIDERHQDEALALIERAIKIAGPLPQLLDTRGCVFTSLGNTREAIVNLKQSSTQNSNATTSLHLAAAYRLAGEDKRADAVFLEAKELGLLKGRIHPLDRKVLEKVAGVRVE